MMTQNRLTNKNLVLNDYHKFFQDPMICPQLTNLLGFISWMDMVISKSNKIYKRWDASTSADKKIEELRKMCTATYDPLHLTLTWNAEIVIVQIDNKQFILPRTVLLMYHNKACDIVSVLLLTLCNKHGAYPENAPQIVIQLLNEMCDLIVRYRSKYFDIIKTLEAMGCPKR